MMQNKKQDSQINQKGKAKKQQYDQLKSSNANMKITDSNKYQGVRNQKQKRESNTFQKSIFGTPKFPFYKWEIYLHFVHISVIVIAMIVQHQIYVQKHYEELATKMQKSHFSSLLQYFFKFLFQDQTGKTWVFTFYRYNSDVQWQAYRSNLITLVLIALFYRCITYFALSKTSQKSNKIFEYTNQFSWLFGFCIISFSFRGDIVFYVGIVIGWYYYVQLLLKIKNIIVQYVIKIKFQKNQQVIDKKFRRDQNCFQDNDDKKTLVKQMKQIFNKTFNQVSIVSFWVIMLAVLYMNEQFDHFRGLSLWFQKFIPSSIGFMRNSNRLIHCSQLLNMTFLKLLSYGIDKIHSTDLNYMGNQKISLLTKHGKNCNQCKTNQNRSYDQTIKLQQADYDYCYKARDLIKAPSFDLKSYSDYVLFAPTLLTGPPISYQNYHSFNLFPANLPKMHSYIYHVFLLFTFQVYQHFFPIIQPTADQTLFEMEIFALFHLIYIWYKFLIIWRTAKVWAILYGVDVIDNMSRCMCDNYGFEGFWRMWHRGFNHWLIRYLYIPLGGNKNYFSVLAVVAFVAFWHDHNFNIILWAFLIVLCMIPELVIKRHFRKNYSHLYREHWFKYLSGVAAAIYIYLLMICNLIGFGYGADQMQIVVQKLANGWFEFLWTIVILMSACMLMFYKRNIEKSQKNY